MEYTRTAIPELIAHFGPADATYLGGVTAELISMQFYSRTAHALGLPDNGDAASFARLMLTLATAQGDSAELTVTGNDIRLRQTSWKLMAGLPPLHASAFEIWNRLLVGALAAHNRRLELKVDKRLDQGDGAFEWRIVPRPQQVAV
jgi:hypothetical protein